MAYERYTVGYVVFVILFFRVAGLCRYTIRLWRVLSTVHPQSRVMTDIEGAMN
jgi:hypothetical protein